MPGRIQTPTVNLRGLLQVCLRPAHLSRTGGVSILVGTWLTVVNHGMLWAEGVSIVLALKIFLNYVTPFVVANAGLLSRIDDS